ncbi:Tn3 family transposase [Streptomyces sp. NBC_00344]|uniref:Tn3 family transposase n=1 Tax=Streptomyces sp. NBC_00344 TaxID=2975720 RepID=UPI003FA6C3FC
MRSPEFLSSQCPRPRATHGRRCPVLSAGPPGRAAAYATGIHGRELGPCGVRGVPRRPRGPARPLGLVLNAVILWNARYPDAAVAQLRAGGHDTKDFARLSPLKDRHINFLGRCTCSTSRLAVPVRTCPFRDPLAVDDED